MTATADPLLTSAVTVRWFREAKRIVLTCSGGAACVAPIVGALAARSATVTAEPLPDDVWEFRFKAEDGNLTAALAAVGADSDQPEGRFMQVPAPWLQLTWVIVQEGGSSSERYLHFYDSEDDAAQNRESCAEAAYRTSAPFSMPRLLADNADVSSALQDAVKAAVELD